MGEGRGWSSRGRVGVHRGWNVGHGGAPRRCVRCLHTGLGDWFVQRSWLMWHSIWFRIPLVQQVQLHFSVWNACALCSLPPWGKCGRRSVADWAQRGASGEEKGNSWPRGWAGDCYGACAVAPCPDAVFTKRHWWQRLHKTGRWCPAAWKFLGSVVPRTHLGKT